MKRLFSLIAIFAIAASTATCVNAEQEETDFSGAQAVVLTESRSGQILYAENADQRQAIASVTKIMTLLIAAEEMSENRLSFEDIIVCSAHANSMDGSVIWLDEGEEMSARDILRSVIISSANDACVALAEHISGSEETFVNRMNERAAELGMTNTHFVNCTGFDDPEHYSTAYDVAIMCAELRKYDCFDEFLLTRLTYVREDTDRAVQLLNTNKLITHFSGITGLKTGTTDNAGYCLSATAKRGDMELIAVVLGASDENRRFDIAENLLEYGFSSYELFTPEIDKEKLIPTAVTGGVGKTVSAEAISDLFCVIPKGSGSDVTYIYDLRESVEAPVEKGDKTGKIIVLLEEETLFVIPVTAGNDVEELTFFKSLEILLKSLLNF